MKTLLHIFMGAVLAALLCHPAAAADPDLAEARKLMNAGKPKQAYALLAPHEFRMAGNRDYDYLLGIAALDGGMPDKATLAFERVLAQDPNSAGARLDMARAYFALGSLERARQELNIVARQNPPPAARLVIDRYLKAIEAQEQGRQTSITGYIEAAAGYDNNITSVVSDFTNAVLATYNIVGLTPTGNSIRRHSPVLAGAMGLEVNHQLDQTLSIYAGADVRHRSVTRFQQYSSDQIDLRAGLSKAFGNNVLRGGITVQQFSQVTDLPTADRSSWGVNAEWRRTVTERDQWSLFAALSRQRLPDIPTSDVNSLLLGGSWMHLFEGARKPLLYASLYAGHDRALNIIPGNQRDNSRRLLGTRVYGQLSLNEAVDAFVNTGYAYRSDLSALARSSLIQHGHEGIWDLSLGLSWRPAHKWVVRPQVTYTTNKSNVPVAEFNRTEASVTVRYEFR